MDSNEIQNDNIKSTLIKIEVLQKEYEVTLQQYQEAGKNYINALQSQNSNPCYNYNKNSTGISQECYNKIWRDQGCLTDASNINTEWGNSQSLVGLVNDSFLWATLTDETYRKGCYGESTNYTNNTSAIFPNNPIFTALKGRAWWGKTGLSEGPAQSQQDCESMCANSEQCSGATFNPVKHYCWTRTGDSQITVGREDDYALITQHKSAISIMKQLNQKLLNINQKISNEIQNINPEIVQQYNDKNKKQKQLSLSYNQLLEQKIELDKQLQEYYSIQEEEENQNLFVTQQNVSFRFWILITCLILIITIKKMLGSSSPSISIITWLIFIILLIILTYSLNKPQGFLMWFIVFIAIVLMKTGNLPSP